jgi:hypothetical protein
MIIELPFGGCSVIPNSCSDYKTADSRAQIHHAGLKAQLNQGDFKRKHKKPFDPRSEVPGIYGLIFKATAPGGVNVFIPCPSHQESETNKTRLIQAGYTKIVAHHNQGMGRVFVDRGDRV